MSEPVSIVPRQLPRRLVLVTALLLALVLASGAETMRATAQQAPSPAVAPAPATKPETVAPSKSKAIAANEADAADKSAAPDDKPPKADESSVPAPAKGSENDAVTAPNTAPDTTPGKQTIVVRKGDRTITITGTADDHDLDSMGKFAKSEPGIALAVVAVVALIFLAPVLAIALVVGYRLKKARMLNETMLKLAEKGIVPPAQALQAVAGGSANGAASIAELAPSTVPLQEQARVLRRRAASSDLRKGIVIGAVGLALSVYSMLGHHSSPNAAGLVLLFLGAGYIVLWWFEQREIRAPGNDRGPGSL